MGVGGGAGEELATQMGMEVDDAVVERAGATSAVKGGTEVASVGGAVAEVGGERQEPLVAATVVGGIAG